MSYKLEEILLEIHPFLVRISSRCNDPFFCWCEENSVVVELVVSFGRQRDDTGYAGAEESEAESVVLSPHQ